MGTLRTIVRAIDAMNEWIGRGISYFVLLATAIIFFEVIARYLMNRPTLWGMLSATWIWGALSVLSGAYVLLHKAHVSMDILYVFLSPRKKAILDICSSVLFFLVIVVMVWSGWKFGFRSIMTGERWGDVWDPPIYPVKITIFVAAVLLGIQGVAKLIRDFVMAVTGRSLVEAEAQEAKE